MQCTEFNVCWLFSSRFQPMSADILHFGYPNFSLRPAFRWCSLAAPTRPFICTRSFPPTSHIPRLEMQPKAHIPAPNHGPVLTACFHAAGTATPVSDSEQTADLKYASVRRRLVVAQPSLVDTRPRQHLAAESAQHIRSSTHDPTRSSPRLSNRLGSVVAACRQIEPCRSVFP